MPCVLLARGCGGVELQGLELCPAEPHGYLPYESRNLTEPVASANAGRASGLQSGVSGPAWLRSPFADTMSKPGLVFLLVALAFVAAVVGGAALRHMAEGKRYFTTMMTYNVGKQLIETTNSSLIVAIGPELHAQLSRLLASTTHVASVRLGDEPAPVGDGRASSRVILTNALAHGLGIRLRLGSDPAGQSRFDVLGHWEFSDAANRGQPVSSETNRTSAAAGPGG